MSDVMFMSRFKFLRTVWTPGRGQALISISNTENEAAEVEQRLEHRGFDPKDDQYILLVFPDNNDGMMPEQAEQLFQFIKRHRGYAFAVHCEMGISRSAAVAKFINTYYDLGNKSVQDHLMWNQRVYRQLQAAAGDSFEAYKASLIEQEERDRSL